MSEAVKFNNGKAESSKKAFLIHHFWGFYFLQVAWAWLHGQRSIFLQE